MRVWYSASLATTRPSSPCAGSALRQADPLPPLPAPLPPTPPRRDNARQPARQQRAAGGLLVHDAASRGAVARALERHAGHDGGGLPLRPRHADAERRRGRRRPRLVPLRADGLLGRAAERGHAAHVGGARLRPQRPVGLLRGPEPADEGVPRLRRGGPHVQLPRAERGPADPLAPEKTSGPAARRRRARHRLRLRRARRGADHQRLHARGRRRGRGLRRGRRDCALADRDLRSRGRALAPQALRRSGLLRILGARRRDGRAADGPVGRAQHLAGRRH